MWKLREETLLLHSEGKQRKWKDASFLPSVSVSFYDLHSALSSQWNALLISEGKFWFIQRSLQSKRHLRIILYTEKRWSLTRQTKEEGSKSPVCDLHWETVAKMSNRWEGSNQEIHVLFLISICNAKANFFFRRFDGSPGASDYKCHCWDIARTPTFTKGRGDWLPLIYQ